ALAIQHLALGRTAAVAEDPPEQQEGLALERVAGGHEVVLELDHERVDVDLVALERHLARLADRVTLRVELGEADPRARMSLGAERAHVGYSMVHSPPMIVRTLAYSALWLMLALSALAPGAAGAADGLHLVLTPSQKPTDLLATGEEFARVLTKLTDIPVRVTVASDYAAVI